MIYIYTLSIMIIAFNIINWQIYTDMKYRSMKTKQQTGIIEKHARLLHKEEQ